MAGSHYQSSQTQIGTMLAQYLAASNLLGRLQITRLASQKTGKAVTLAAGSHLRQTFAAQDSDDLSVSFDVPPQGAIDYLRNLTPVTRQVFDGLTSQYQQQAFGIAGVNDQRLLAKIRDAMAETATTGQTQDHFRTAVNKLTDAAGVERLAAFELDTVFQTNLGKALGVGRYEQMSDEGTAELLPFWQYWTVGDARVRPEHRVLDQFCAHAVDPVWRKIYPPCGYNCRCSVVPLLASEAPKGSEDGGLERLPLLAIALVPQPGFRSILAA